MPQFDYTHPTLLLGQVANGNPYTINSYLNALLAQESEITIGAGPAAGDYTTRIVGEEGTFEFTYTSPGAETEAQIVAGMLAALNSDPDPVTIVAGTDASPELELDFIHPGADYTISFPSNPGPGDMSQALIQAAGGTALNLAIAVVASDPAGISTGAQHVTAPDAGTVDAVAYVNDEFCVVDFKTSSGIWDEYFLQVAAYAEAVAQVHGDAIESAWILRFDKKTGEFEAGKSEDINADFRAFLGAQQLHERLRQLKNKR